mgnify:CR=1 FL=1
MNGVQQERWITKVKQNTSLLLACLLWSIVNVNILRIGLIAHPAYKFLLNLLLSVPIFVVFQKFIFEILVKKYTVRINTYPEERHFYEVL